MTKEELKKQLKVVKYNLEKTQVKALRYYQSYNILKNYWDNNIDSSTTNLDPKIYDVKKKLKNLIF
tara:strand:+ start:341 stop:538 length:198 start_codon:yes stop_codon:yes gene_type:complete